MKTRIIHTRFWQDSYVSKLNHREKILFIYLLTNDRIGMTGMYELPDKYIKVDLDLTNKELLTAKDKFQKDGKVFFSDGWIKIINHDKYNSYTGEKLETAKNKELAGIPEKLKGIDRVSIGYPVVGDTPNNHKSKTINHKSKIKKSKFSSVGDISEQDLVNVSKEYQVSLGFVKLQFEKMKNWLKSSGKVKKDYMATLRNFVLGDMQKHIERSQDDKYRAVDARHVK